MIRGLLVLCLALVPAVAADWPRLGGVDGGGVSAETGLARSFPLEGPPVLWSVDVGDGFAGPAISRGEVFLLDRVGNQEDVLRCLDLQTGTQLWAVSYDAAGTLPYNGSRNVPTVDDEYVFSIGPFGHLQCVERRSHQVVWKVHLIQDFQDAKDTAEPARTQEEKLGRTQLPMWGMVQSPLLYQDLVIVAPQTATTGLVAYQKATGKKRWRSGYIGRNWYSHVSPYLARLCGVDQVIMLAQPSDPGKPPDQAPPAIISSIDPLNGKILWTTNTPGPHKIPIAGPLSLGNDRLFITGGYKLGCLMLQVLHTDGGWAPRLLFRNKNVAGHIHSPVLYGGRIFATSFKDQGGNRTGLVCLDLNGEPLWETGPTLQFDYGNYLFADGMAYVMHGKTGELCLLGLSGDGYQLLARVKVLEAKGASVWAPMALADGKLLVRDQHQMKCLAVGSLKPTGRPSDTRHMPTVNLPVQ